MLPQWHADLKKNSPDALPPNHPADSSDYSSMKEEKEAIRQTFLEGCSLLGIDVVDEGMQKLELYYAELLRWSKKINLIAKKQSSEQIIETHFLDSLMLLSYMNNNSRLLVDVGSGAGFPGLVCKAVLPKLQLVIIEPRLKRVSFLRHIIRTLKLKDVDIIAERVEDIPAGSFPGAYVTSRAVAEIDEFLLMIQHLIGEDTRIISMKGPRWKEEMERAVSSLQDSNLELTQVDEFSLPYSGAKRALLYFSKIESQ